MPEFKSNTLTTAVVARQDMASGLHRMAYICDEVNADIHEHHCCHDDYDSVRHQVQKLLPDLKKVTSSDTFSDVCLSRSAQICKIVIRSRLVQQVHTSSDTCDDVDIEEVRRALQCPS